MLRKRVIFTLIYSDGFFMQSRNFRLQKVGDIDWLKKNYQFQKIAFSIDELIVLNASREIKKIEEFSRVVEQLSQDVFIPVSAGGGIKSMKDAEILFNSGADKIVLNTILYKNPALVRELINRYGSQSIVASVDYKINQNMVEVFVENGTEKINFNLDENLAYLENLKIGEIYFNSIDQDGTGFGYDLETIARLEKINTPLIIAGGAGNEKHLTDGININHVSAVATANLFNFVGNGLPNARKKMIDLKINLAVW